MLQEQFTDQCLDMLKLHTKAKCCFSASGPFQCKEAVTAQFTEQVTLWNTCLLHILPSCTYPVPPLLSQA